MGRAAVTCRKGHLFAAHDVLMVERRPKCAANGFVTLMTSTYMQIVRGKVISTYAYQSGYQR